MARAPRVLFVTHNFPRFAGDAAGSFVWRLARALIDRGADVHVLAPAAAGLSEREMIDGVLVQRVSYAREDRQHLAYEGTMAEQVRASWSGRFAFAGLLWSLRQATHSVLREAHRKATPFDVVHAHWWFPAGLALRYSAIGKSRRTPLVITLHGSDVRLARTKAYVHPIMRSVLANANAVTAVSSWLATEAQRIAPQTPLLLAPMPVDAASFAPQKNLNGQPSTVPPSTLSNALAKTVNGQPSTTPPSTPSNALSKTVNGQPSTVPPSTLSNALAKTVNGQPSTTPPSTPSNALSKTVNGQPSTVPPSTLSNALAKTVNGQPSTTPPSTPSNALSKTVNGQPSTVPPSTLSNALSPPRILFVGRLNPQKGPADLCDALARTAHPVHCDIVGDGPDRDTVHQLARTLGLTTRITWHGALPSTALPALYQQALATVMPSREEGLGLVAVESQLCGTPVIAYDSGGLPDVVQPEHGGVLVTTGDTAALARAIDAMADDPANARAMGLRARELVLSRFSPEHVADQYLTLYASVAQRSV